MNIHEKDQLWAAFRDIAESLAAYRDQLIKQGFARDEILQLLINYQSVLLMKPQNKEE